MRKSIVAAALACAACLGTMAGVPTVEAQEQMQVGPKGLVIQYRAGRESRAAFRHYLIAKLAPRLQAMRKAGEISDFRLFYSWYRQPDVWDAMLVVNFPTPEAVAAWNDLEKTAPGGLDAEGLALADPHLTASVDLLFDSNRDVIRDGQVYYVIPYEYANFDAYYRYVKEYVIPQFDGWEKHGAIDGYEIFFNRYQVGRPWDALFIQHYHDLAAFGDRHTVKEEVRVGLKADPAWKAWSENKGDIRSETENTIAELIAH